MEVTKELIIEHFPCKKPYCFVEDIVEVDSTHILATYTFKKQETFFKGHFPGNPVVPGAILQESAAQIGLLAFGMYLLGNGIETLSELPIELPASLSSMTVVDLSAFGYKVNHLFYLTSANMDYKFIIRPQEKIFVRAEKVFFRLNKLKCNVRIENEAGQLVAKGVLSGVVVNSN
jgi:3-hydroxyacyl-[acyl-carrier-protein] dehydratase